MRPFKGSSRKFDDFDLQQKWTWVYLAQLMGTDLTVSDHYAIHEDGSMYYDDVGGPMYVDGRDALGDQILG